jgi:hypothetical protein
MKWSAAWFYASDTSSNALCWLLNNAITFDENECCICRALAAGSLKVANRQRLYQAGWVRMDGTESDAII